MFLGILAKNEYIKVLNNIIIIIMIIIYSVEYNERWYVYMNMIR